MIDEVTRTITETIDEIVLQDVETVITKKVPRKVVEEIEEVVYDTVRKVVVEQVERQVLDEVTEIQIQEIEKIVYDEVITNSVELIEETVIDEVQRIETTTEEFTFTEEVTRTEERQVPTVDLVDVTREGVRDEEYTFTVPVTKNGVRQVQRQYYDVENRERQVARYVVYSSDSGDGINSGPEDARLSLDSFGDSDVDNDLADNIGYIKAAKHGPEAGAKFGYSGPHPGAHWKEGQEFSSEDDLTLSDGDATSDDLFVSADSSDDLRVVYDTVVDRVVVPRTETIDVPF